MRICRSCGEAKPIAEYHADPAGRGGYRRDCKGCKRAAMRRYCSERSAARSAAKRAVCADARELGLRREIRDPWQLEALDRDLRRAELADLGGLCGVRAIRDRIRRASLAKSLCGGGEIPAGVLDAILPA